MVGQVKAAVDVDEADEVYLRELRYAADKAAPVKNNSSKEEFSARTFESNKSPQRT